MDAGRSPLARTLARICFPARTISRCAVLLLTVTLLLAVRLDDARGNSVVKPTLVVTVKNGRLTVVARDVLLTDVLREIGKKSGVRVRVDDNVAEPVTASFANLPLDEAIRRLCRWRSFLIVFNSSAPTEVHVYSAAPGGAGTPTALAIPVNSGAQSAKAFARESNVLFGERVRELRALAEARNDAGVPTLASVLTADPDPRIRAQAAMALAVVKSSAALAALMQAVSDPDTAVRGRVVAALRRFPNEWAVATLERISQDDSDAQVRERALTAVRWLRRGRVTP